MNPGVRGPRAELIAELEEQAEGWWHLAKDKLSAEAFEGAADLANGAASVRVGHLVYEVTDPTSGC